MSADKTSITLNVKEVGFAPEEYEYWCDRASFTDGFADEPTFEGKDNAPDERITFKVSDEELENVGWDGKQDRTAFLTEKVKEELEEVRQELDEGEDDDEEA